MREQEWLTCTDPLRMLDSLSIEVEDRGARLFAVACCRRVWHLLRGEASREAVEVAERFAEGIASDEEREDFANHAKADRPATASASWDALEAATATAYAAQALAAKRLRRKASARVERIEQCNFNVGPGDAAGLIADINTANNNGQSNTIDLAAGSTYDLTQINNFWYGPDGLPAIRSNLTINGNGATIQRDASAPDFRLFSVSGGFDGLAAPKKPLAMPPKPPPAPLAGASCPIPPPPPPVTTPLLPPTASLLVNVTPVSVTVP